MLTDGTNTYAYNAESEIKSAASVTYTGVYPELARRGGRSRRNGDGNRVEKASGTIYWYTSASLSPGGAGTEILDESNSSGTITNEYVFFGGKRVAMRNVTSGTIYYYEEDMLRSSRTQRGLPGRRRVEPGRQKGLPGPRQGEPGRSVQAGQTSVCYDADFYPFGGERDITNTCTQNYKFEGKERDTETGNDDFGARYYTSRLGRWLSADWSSVPEAVPYANLTNPQTLNLYAMVRDNPETFADLDGHVSCGQTLPGSNEDCTKTAPSPAATTGGNDPASNTSGDSQPQSPSATAAQDAADANAAQQQNPNQNQDAGQVQNQQQPGQQQSNGQQNQPSSSTNIPGRLPPAANPAGNAAKQKTFRPQEETKPELRKINRPAPKILGEKPVEELTRFERITLFIARFATAVANFAGRLVVPVMVRPPCNSGPGAPPCMS
ncbi:MAG TPA: RHS repeat-associated core domain-containing protein [Candidatus Acidoferrales bacterium]|nr:RHS repeat-associated core domain-containing protein [Candidatus Acidoferrales bacterium]